MGEPTFENDRWHISDFACSCGDDGPKEMEELFQFAKNHEYKNEENWTKYNRHFLDRILVDLMSYHVYIDMIAYDMWGGISASTGDKIRKPLSLFIQFDRFEDGLYLLLKRVVEFYVNKEDNEILKET
jgi:hypothetical protein